MSELSGVDALPRALAETAAMRSIAQILGELPDAESRTRVLRWCQEHFHPTPSSLTPSNNDRYRPEPPSADVVDDSGLTLGEDLFDDVPAKADQVHCEDVDCDCGDLEFSEEELSGLEVEIETAPQEPVSPRTVSSGLGLESLLRDFVCDFQRLALECRLA